MKRNDEERIYGKARKELKARGVADAADIEEEYEQHFAFKLADGYSEEEIAAKLGGPAKLAAQFTVESAPAGSIEFWHVWGWFTAGV